MMVSKRVFQQLPISILSLAMLVLVACTGQPNVDSPLIGGKSQFESGLSSSASAPDGEVTVVLYPPKGSAGTDAAGGDKNDIGTGSHDNGTPSHDNTNGSDDDNASDGGFFSGSISAKGEGISDVLDNGNGVSDFGALPKGCDEKELRWIATVGSQVVSYGVDRADGGVDFYVPVYSVVKGNDATMVALSKSRKVCAQGEAIGFQTDVIVGVSQDEQILLNLSQAFDDGIEEVRINGVGKKNLTEIKSGTMLMQAVADYLFSASEMAIADSSLQAKLGVFLERNFISYFNSPDGNGVVTAILTKHTADGKVYDVKEDEFKFDTPNFDGKISYSVTPSEGGTYSIHKVLFHFITDNKKVLPMFVVGGSNFIEAVFTLNPGEETQDVLSFPISIKGKVEFALLGASLANADTIGATLANANAVSTNGGEGNVPDSGTDR